MRRGSSFITIFTSTTTVVIILQFPQLFWISEEQEKHILEGLRCSKTVLELEFGNVKNAAL